MKGKQMAMDSALADIDRAERVRLNLQNEETIRRMDEKYERVDYNRLCKQEYAPGSVIIIGQYIRWGTPMARLELFRTVLNYYSNRYGVHETFVEGTNAEYPDRPIWADTVGHEGELKDIHWYSEHIHWFMGEVVEPIETWWMKEWREFREREHAKGRH